MFILYNVQKNDVVDSAYFLCVQLKWLGPLEHRLTVQGTDESYERTKKKMEQVELERSKNKAQEIRIVTKGCPRLISQLTPISR